MKIAIDGRRNFGSGIGRVTSNLIDGLLRVDSFNEFHIFTSREITRNESNAFVHHLDIPFFSMRDIHELPKIIEDLDIDVFVSPQFYISPYIKVPSIKMVHDLWPLVHREWIPSEHDFVTNFGQESATGIVEFISKFKHDYSRGTVFPNNKYLSSELGRTDLKHTERYLLSMMAATLNSATRIVIPSIHTESELREHFPEVMDKVTIIHNFPSPIFHIDTLIETKEPYILHVAKWEPRKNIECLLSAARMIYERHKLKLVLVGDQGYRDYGRQIAALISESSISEYVEYKGVLSDEELSEFYRKAFAFVFPSLYEGFGIPPIESMSCGTPVVTSNTTALPEVCGNAAILVNPKDDVEIANAVSQLFYDKKLYRQKVEDGLARASEFSEYLAISRFRSTILSIAKPTGTDTMHTGIIPFPIDIETIPM